MQCYFHCTTLVFTNLTSHFLHIGAGHSIFDTLLTFPSRGPLKETPLLPLDSRVPNPPPCAQLPIGLAWWMVRLQRYEIDEPKTALPTPHGHPSMPSQEHRKTRTCIWSTGISAWAWLPWHHRAGTHIKSPSSASEVQLEQPKRVPGRRRLKNGIF